MTSILLIVQIVLVVLLTIAVLLQKSSSIGLGAYSGSNESVFGAKGPGSFLAKTTFFLGFLFVANTIALGYFYAQASNKSVVDTITTPITAPAPVAPKSVPAPATQAPEANASH
jgi:preprotein translocase subunit SecG